MIRGWRFAFVALVLAVSAVLGLEAAEPRRLKVLTTLAPIYSWTASVAGDRAEVENLLPADVGPHDFQFRPADLRKVQKADLIVLNGLGIEAWLETALRNNVRVGPGQVVRTTDGLKAELIRDLPTLSLDPATSGKDAHGHGDGHDHDHGDHAPNPHLWLDPVYARHGVSNILSALCARDPANTSVYRANATAYLGQLQALDDDLRKATAGLQHKAIVTFHDAFPYFTRRYGFELVGVVEEVPSVAPSPKYLSNLSRVIRSRGIRVIFTEPQFEPKLVRQLSKDLSIRFTELDVLETGPLRPGFYVEGMRRNLKTLVGALQ